MATFSDLLQGLWKQRLGQTWVNPALRADTCWEHRGVPASSPLLYHKRWAAFAGPCRHGSRGRCILQAPSSTPHQHPHCSAGETAVCVGTLQSGAWDSPPVVYCRTPFPSFFVTVLFIILFTV